MAQRQVEIHVYKFICPDCGMGDAELGHLAGQDDIHCTVCLIDEDRYVRLRRWLDDEQAASASGVAAEAATPKPHLIGR